MTSFQSPYTLSEPVSVGSREDPFQQTSDISDFGGFSLQSNLSSSLPNFSSALSSSVPNSMSSANSGGPDHYKNVKMKYFRSLGVNQPGGAPQEPRNRSNTDLDGTNPSALASTNNPSNPQGIPVTRPKVKESPNRKKRSVSTPIPIGPGAAPMAIPSSGRRGAEEEDEIDEEEEEEYEDDDGSFIPPHEMMARQMGQGFAVGTAHSLAVWEQQKRRNLYNV